MKSESLSFRDRFGILLEKRLSSVAGLKYTILYGKSQLRFNMTSYQISEARKRAEAIINIGYERADVH
jgi:hypothetical protein